MVELIMMIFRDGDVIVIILIVTIIILTSSAPRSSSVARLNQVIKQTRNCKIMRLLLVVMSVVMALKGFVMMMIFL